MIDHAAFSDRMQDIVRRALIVDNAAQAEKLRAETRTLLEELKPNAEDQAR